MIESVHYGSNSLLKVFFWDILHILVIPEIQVVGNMLINA